MDIEEKLEEILATILDKIGTDYSKIEVEQDSENNYAINIESANASQLIGYHGETIQALQHVLKVLSWRECNNEHFNITLDIDNYRKRQEENVIKLTERKVDNARRTGRKQFLPPMSPYFRRKIHMHCMGAGFDDIETISEGQGERRHIIIKLKS